MQAQSGIYEDGGRWGQRSAANNVRKERGKANTTMSIRGKVGAGESHRAAIAAQFWMRLVR
jgi:hypothetical protein